MNRAFDVAAHGVLALLVFTVAAGSFVLALERKAIGAIPQEKDKRQREGEREARAERQGEERRAQEEASGLATEIEPDDRVHD